MVEYRCECCNYVTTRKSNLDNHNQSKKHQEKLNGSFKDEEVKDEVKSVLNSSEKSYHISTENSTVSNDNYLTLKIRELENALKLKELENQSLKNENETLKQIIQSKNETIDLLKSNKMNITMPIQEPTNKKVLKEEEQLTMINIEDFYETYIKNVENEYTFKFKSETASFIGLKSKYFKKDFCRFNTMNAVMNIITNALKQLPKNVSFYKCKDENRRRFDIKSNDTIVDSKNVEKIDQLILELFKKTFQNLLTAYCNMISYFSKRWTYFNEKERIRLDEIDDKVFNRQPLTEQERLMRTKRKTNIAVNDEFKLFAGYDYEDFKYVAGSELGVAFNSFDEKEYNAGFSHLRTLLATNKYDRTKINKEHEATIKMQLKEEEEDEPNYYDSESE